MGIFKIEIYCDMPGSPCLSKKGESNVWFVSFKIFCLGSYICGRTKGSLAACLVAARAVCWRPRLTSTRHDRFRIEIFFTQLMAALCHQAGVKTLMSMVQKSHSRTAKIYLIAVVCKMGFRERPLIIWGAWCKMEKKIVRRVAEKNGVWHH